LKLRLKLFGNRGVRILDASTYKHFGMLYQVMGRLA
jgi:hypothetical protein